MQIPEHSGCGSESFRVSTSTLLERDIKNKQDQNNACSGFFNQISEQKRSCHFLQCDINIATATCPIFGIGCFADGLIAAMQSIPNIGALRKDVLADQHIALKKKT